MKRSLSVVRVSTFVFVFTMAGLSTPAHARLTRINAGAPILIDLPAFGRTGAYLKIAGTFEGELDPADRRNAVIADIDLAPLENGNVRYTSTFFLLRPAELSRGNAKLFYDFGNRGSKRILQWFNDGTDSNDPSTPAEFGHGFLMRQGYIVALSGWAADVAPAPNIMSIDVPIAANSDGSPITGLVVAESIPSSDTANTIALPYAASRTTSDNGVLTVREHQADPKVPVEGWTYVSPRQIRFPAPAAVQWIYEFVYEGKDPAVMGIGHAATRDFLSFVKHASQDDFGNPNPVAMRGGLRAIYSWGRSQGGRVERDFLYYSFNEDEDGQLVIDGMMPYATGSGGLIWMNFRFAQPTVSAQQHSRHHSHEPEFPHTFAVRTDPLTGQTDGILLRCLSTGTCPRFFNIDGGNEYWNKTSSLNHTDAYGDDLDVDRLAPNVRIYSIASIEHNTTFDRRPEQLAACQQLTNPLYNGPIFRALPVRLDRWVIRGIRPPASRVAKRSQGTLVSPEEVNFPSIPATAYADWPKLPAVQFNPGVMNHNAVLDFSVVPPEHVDDLEYAVQVAQVDADGNDIAGIRLPYLAVPLGTHTGWSLLKPGMGGPDICGQNGQFIPFANTRAERLAAGDPRLSIEERYRNHRAYVSSAARAAERLVREGFLLEEDEDRIVTRAARQGTDLWKMSP